MGTSAERIMLGETAPTTWVTRLTYGDPDGDGPFTYVLLSKLTESRAVDLAVKAFDVGRNYQGMALTRVEVSEDEEEWREISGTNDLTG